MTWDKVLSTTVARKIPAVRRGIALAAQFTDMFAPRPDFGGKEFSRPIFVNSIPKSGTHLALQIAGEIDGTRYLGRFVAERPSLTLHQRSDRAMQRRISSIRNGEIAGGHVHFREATRQALETRRVVHLFIRRDPAEMVLAECHYLRTMARHHRMSGQFRKAGVEGALDLAVFGSPDRPDLFPPFSQRIAPFLGWIGNGSVLELFFEDLADPTRRRSHLMRIAWFLQGQGLDPGRDFCARAARGIRPETSHTFSGRNRSEGAKLQDRHLEELAPIRRALGYGQRPRWRLE